MGTIWIRNPFRYRGYYLDSETGLYYLHNRYYDPQTCRFLNADTTDILEAKGDLYDKNLFAYCDNNPVARVDYGGEFWVQVGATFGGFLLSGGLELANQLLSGKKPDEVNWNSVVIEGISGAATGLLMSYGLPAAAVVRGRTAINFVTSVAHSINEGDGFIETISKATFSSALTVTVNNVKPIGQYITRGRHAKLGIIGSAIRELTYTPKHMIQKQSLGGAIISKTIKSIFKIISEKIINGD